MYLELCWSSSLKISNLKSVMSSHQVMTVQWKHCLQLYRTIFDMSLDNFVKLNQYNVTTFYDIKLNTKKEEFSQSQRNYYKWLSNFKSFMKNFNSILFCIYEERRKFPKSIVCHCSLSKVSFQIQMKKTFYGNFLNPREAFCWYQDELEELVIYQHFITKKSICSVKVNINIVRNK